MKTSFGIAILFCAGTLAQASYLDNGAKLVDLQKGDSIVAEKDFDIYSGTGLGSSQLYFPDCGIHAKKFPEGEPLKKTLRVGDHLKIESVEIKPYGPVTAVVINFDDDYIDNITCRANLILGQTDATKLTSLDLRRALIWQFWIDAANRQASRAQNGASSKTSEDTAKTTESATPNTESTGNEMAKHSAQ